MTFDAETIIAVWEKGRTVASNDPAVYRKDKCGAWMHCPSYGDRDSQYGWKIDHITPVKSGGLNQLINRRPLQWQNNSPRGALGELVCTVTAHGTNNGPA